MTFLVILLLIPVSAFIMSGMLMVIEQLFCPHEFRLKTVECLDVVDGKLVGAYQYIECCKCHRLKRVGGSE